MTQREGIPMSNAAAVCLFNQLLNQAVSEGFPTMRQRFAALPRLTQESVWYACNARQVISTETIADVVCERIVEELSPRPQVAHAGDLFASD